jgi:hypothetical protein
MLIVSWAAAAFAAEETPLSTRITSLGLFKNGLAVVERTIAVEKPGVYRVDDVPEPLHGTYWIESDTVVTTRVTQRMIDVPLGKAMPGDIQNDLAGREVVVHFAEQGLSPTSGTVMGIEPPRGSAAWNRSYEQPNYYYFWNREPSWPGGGPAPTGGSRFLLLTTKDGQTYIDPGKIAYLEAKGDTAVVRRRKAVLLLTVGELKQKKATISISYLAKGIAWAPSYRVDITDPKTLHLKQSAVVKNELEPFADAQVRLISGFPSVHFGHVASPLAPTQNWTTFFQQLNQRVGRSNAAATQQVIMNNRAAPDDGIDLSAIPTGEGVDVHYQDIGRQTLDEGDALSLETASGKAAYDRIVEWSVPDTRQANGHYIEDYDRQNEKYEDAVWDAVRFRNPFNFPMTTAPAMIVADGKFNGQQMSYWVNPGEETTLHVTKALSVRTRSIEQESDGGRDLVYNGVAYRKTVLDGTLEANNHRNETITLVIRRRCCGALNSADKNPKTSLLEEGAGYVNKRNELLWTLPLKPGEEVKLNYRYSLLVRR